MTRLFAPYLPHSRPRPDGTRKEIKLTDAICDLMMERGENIKWLSWDPLYPWAYSEVTGSLIARLHRHARELAAELGLRNPLPSGWEVHHLNKRKNDCRLENLDAMPPDKHARLHAAEHRPRRNDPRRAGLQLARDPGFWDPSKEKPSAPRQLTTSELGSFSPRVTRVVAIKDDADARIKGALLTMLPGVADGVRSLDSGKPLRRTQGSFTDSRSKTMGVRRWVRLGCHDHEAALVGLFVMCRSDRTHDRNGLVVSDSIADAILAEIARNKSTVGLPTRAVVSTWIDRTIRQPAVNLALHRWWVDRRLPPQLVKAQ